MNPMKKVACVVLSMSSSSPDTAEIRAQPGSYKSWNQFHLAYALRLFKYKERLAL